MINKEATFKHFPPTFMITKKNTDINIIRKRKLFTLPSRGSVSPRENLAVRTNIKPIQTPTPKMWLTQPIS